METKILNLDWQPTKDRNIELRITVDYSPEKLSELCTTEGLVCRIEKERKKRSLDANSYMWVLCDSIAKAIRSTKEEVYQKAIREVGEWEDTPISVKALKMWIESWNAKGTGWFAEVQREAKFDGYRVVRNYFGSSIYDTQSMARLIDYIVEEAKGLGIDTRTPNEIEEMKARWK